MFKVGSLPFIWNGHMTAEEPVVLAHVMGNPMRSTVSVGNCKLSEGIKMIRLRGSNYDLMPRVKLETSFDYKSKKKIHRE